MKIFVVILIVLVVLLSSYILFLEKEIININRKLVKRLEENTRHPINIILLNKRLNNLVCSINKALKVEENLRLKVIKDENEFKEMITNLSHDLRTPLTAIKGYQQSVKKGLLNEEEIEKLDIAIKHTEELGKLVNNFFAYAYYLSYQEEVTLERINLNNIVTECLVNSIPAFEDKSIAIEFEKSSTIFVKANEEFLRRIIQNLIDNCLKHSIGNLKVQLLALDYAVVSFRNPVKDSCNIDVSKIFKRFYTGDKARNTSTGLGLSIVEILTEEMGGKVEANLVENMLEIKVKLKMI